MVIISYLLKCFTIYKYRYEIFLNWPTMAKSNHWQKGLSKRISKHLYIIDCDGQTVTNDRHRWTPDNWTKTTR